MKKRLLALLLVTVMIASLIVLPAGAESVDFGSTPKTTCPHCGQAWDSIEWKEFGYSAEAALEGTGILTGHYYVADDQKVKSAYTFGSHEGQTEDLAVDVCVDLQGCTIEASKADTRVLFVYNYSRLSIIDSVGGGQIIGTNKTGSGGTIYQAKNSRVDLYSGKLVNAQTDRTKNGGVVFVNVDAQFNMSGGEMDASQVTGSTVAGGAIANYGTVNISGGIIRGGAAKNGGAIQNPAGSVVNISGGLIYGGNATSRGGNINNNGELNISGGTISGGTTTLTGDIRGGNIFSATSTAILNISGGVIENGQCSGHNGNAYGGNVTFTGGATTISGGTIRGGVAAWAAATITGAPVIDNFGYEGMTVYSSAKMTIKDLDENAKIIIRHYNENSTFSGLTTAAGSPDVATYLEEGKLVAASRYSLTVNDSGVLGSTLDNTGYCPHCQKEVSWGKYAATTVNSGHYFVGGSGLTLAAGDAALTVASGKDIVLDLNRGLTISAPYTVAGTLTLLSNNGSVAKLTSTATDVENGGVATVTGTLNIYDAYVTGNAVTGNGGLFYVNSGKLNMYGGWLQGVSAASGGSVYVNGANGQFNLSGGVVTGGSTTGNGGNVGVYNGKITVDGGIIADGYAASNGGNIIVSTSGDLIVNDGLIIGGSAKNRGGNIASTVTNGLTEIYGGLIADGIANYGGNAYFGHGKLNMYGGTMAYGTGNQYGGNLALYGVFNSSHTNSCFSYIGDNNAEDDMAAPVLFGGDSPLGGNLYLDGIATIGDCDITGSTEAVVPALYLGNDARLTLEETFDSELIVQIGYGKVAELENDRYLSNTTCEGLQATLFVQNFDMAQLVENENHQLALSGAALVDVATGNQTWYLDAQTAYDDYAAGTYLKLYTPQTLTVSGNVVLDLNGNNATITGSGTDNIVYGFDTANDDFDGYGVAAVSGVAVEPIYRAVNNKTYVAVTEGNTVSFHNLGIRISNVSLRPSISGVYYQGIWQCDSVLQDRIKTFGVAVSVVNMPGADFATDTDTLYTQFGKDEFVSGQAKTSVMIANIVKEDADNNDRGAKPIYAAPYMVFDDGTEAGLSIVFNDSDPAAGGVSYSLKDVLEKVDRVWPKLSEVQQNGVKSLYNIDTAVMGSWKLYNTKASIEGTPSIRPLKVLCLGNSSSSDALHMMNLVAAAEGFSEQELLVGILYYSGCTLTQHVGFIRGNSPEYQLYIASSLTPNVPREAIADVSMQEAITYTDWDIIVMQAGGFESDKETTYTNGNIQFIQNYVNQHKTNPNAIFSWHVAGIGSTDPDLMAMYPYSPNPYETEYGKYNYDRNLLYGARIELMKKHILTDSSFVYFIPTGTATENAITSYLGQKGMKRDYGHLSDLGRVISSYYWYCVMTGIDCLDEIKLDTIPVAFFKSTTGTEDRVLTEMEKAIILESVNNALANPLEITQSQYTEAPTK